MKGCLQLTCLVIFLVSLPASAQVCDSSPVALEDQAGTDDQRVLLIDVLANDSDPDGEPLEVALLSSTCAGQASARADQSLVYQPVPGLAEDCTLTYRASDAAGNASTAVVTLGVELADRLFVDGFESGDVSAWSPPS